MNHGHQCCAPRVVGVWNAVIVRPSDRSFVRGVRELHSCRTDVYYPPRLSVCQVPSSGSLSFDNFAERISKTELCFRKQSLLIFFENPILETDFYMIVMYYFLASCLPLSLSISTPSTNRERATRLSLVINHKINITTVAHFYRFARIDTASRYS